MKKTIFLFFAVLISMALSVAAQTIVIDFESFNEYDSVSTVSTAYGNVGFYMTNAAAVQTSNLGDYIALAPTGDLPEISEEDTKTSPSDYIKIVGHTVNDQLYGGTDIYRDDYVADDQGTGAGGKMLTDTRDMTQSDLMKHAYSKGQSIVIDLTGLTGVISVSFAAIDLDHNEFWKFIALDSSNQVIDILTTGPGVSGGDGKAYPFSFNNPNVAKIALWGWNNNANSGIVGYAFDNFEIELEEQACEDYTVDLIAGGGNPKSAIDVGEVIVSSDGETLEVTYQTDDGWGITETHLHVACDLEDIPQTQPNKKDLGGGNPIPGHFDYNNNFDPAVTEHTVTINLDDLCCTDPLIAAHAVVRETTCDGTDVVYGIQRYTGTIYGVDVTGGSSWIEFDTSPPPNAGSATPNGLAYDAVNDRFYYCDYYSPNTLYFWDTSQHVAGTLIGNVADAGFYNGKYYYISGPPASDDLYVVEFNTDGTIKTGFPQKIADIANNAHGWTFDGDIAVKDNIVYGWGRCGIHGKFEYFTYNLGTAAFNLVTTTYQSSLQLAFGSDGNLYGHRSSGSGDWFNINIIDGSVTYVSSPGVLFTDAASGELCIPSKTETAWGEGDGFPGANWAMYFSYDLSECYEPQCESNIPTGAAITSTPETTWLGMISILSLIALVIVSVTAFNKLSKK